jgi:hypothetical protein
MRHALKLHPDSRCQAVTRIEVEPRRTGVGLALRYIVTGAITDLALPKWAKPERTDDLWKHTCFEAFVRGAGDEAYCEFNFSPSTEWAAYRFSKYRRETALDIGEVNAPAIVLRDSPTHFQMDIAIDLSRVAELPTRAPWRAGVSAVIEEKSGQKSYWALAHPQGKPDFHHADSFVLQLPPAEQR